MNNFRCAGIIFGCVLVALPGCGDDMGLTSVSGIVTLDGKPLPNAVVTFIPQGEGGSPSYGTTDAEGYYTLMFSRDTEGVLPGTHDVTITTEKIAPSDVAVLKAKGRGVPEFVPVPKKYRQPGELVREVEPGGGEINFELTSENQG